METESAASRNHKRGLPLLGGRPDHVEQAEEVREEFFNRAYAIIERGREAIERLSPDQAVTMRTLEMVWLSHCLRSIRLETVARDWLVSSWQRPIDRMTRALPIGAQVDRKWWSQWDEDNTPQEEIEPRDFEEIG